MAVSKTYKGWRWDRVNDRLDFYYNGTRIGHIDSGGIDLASGKDYEIIGSSSSGGVSSLDTAYDGGRSITVDSGTLTLASNQANADTLTLTEADNSNTKSLIDLTHARTASKDIDGTASSWSVTGAGAASFAAIAGTTLTLSADIDMSASSTGTYDIILNDGQADALSIRRASDNMMLFDSSTPAIVITPATTITGALTLDGGLTISTGGATIAGTVAITGSLSASGSLSVEGNIDWGGNFTVDELILDTDGIVTGLEGGAYVISDNSGDLTLNAKTGSEVHIGINSNDEFSVSTTEVNIHGNILVLDGDGNTKLDCATGDTIKIFVAGSQDFTITADTFTVDTGSAVVLSDLCHLAIGTTLDTVLVNASAGLGANTTLGGVTVGTPVTQPVDSDSLIISNITTDADIMICVSDNGHSQTMIWCDGSAGEIFLNSTTSGTGHLTIANTDEYTWTDAAFIIAAGNDLQFAGADGIIDGGGASLIQFTATGSAANYLQVINAVAGDPITLQCLGSDDKGFMFEATNNEEILELVASDGATTYMQITSANDAAVTLSSTGETNTDLKLDTAGTGNIIFALGGAETLAFHDAGITLAGATGAAGHALYMQTEDGGAASSGAGQAGGAWEIRTGDGTASDTGGQVGGAGGALTLVSGLGHDGNAGGQGGVGGAIAITAGEGGDAGSGAAGAGGSITLTAGAGGGAGTGTSGIPGSIVIGAGVLKLKKQTIDMVNAEKVLTLDPTDPVLGVLLAGNILYVDPNGGGGPVLKLPDEDDCDGLFLQIINTAGAAEVLTIQTSSSGSIVACTQNETAYVVCDGSTWRGTVGIA